FSAIHYICRYSFVLQRRDNSECFGLKAVTKVWIIRAQIRRCTAHGGIHMKSLRLTVAMMLTLAALSFSALAQTATTSLRGTITDPNGALVTNAEVTLSNTATGFSRATKTAGDGVYQFLQVPPATYTLTVEAGGFATLKQDNVILQVNLPSTLDLSLQVKTTSEVIEVTGAAPLVNTTDA